MAEKVIIKEVAARDGLQAQPKHLSVEQRIALLGALAQTGVPELEIGSFVSPKAVPQMAGTDDIAANLPPAQLAYSALVPNMKGYELAVMAGIRSHAIALAATEEMNQNNIRKSLEDTFIRGRRFWIVRQQRASISTPILLWRLSAPMREPLRNRWCWSRWTA